MASKELLRSMRQAFSMTHQRCYNPDCSDFLYYGGRGVQIDVRWKNNFDQFFRDMGPRPEGMTLERKDNDGPYSPENCVWASRCDQTRNRRLTRLFMFQGRSTSITELAEIAGVRYHTMKARLTRLGYTPEEAVSKEAKCGARLPGRAYRERRSPDMSRVLRGMASPKTALSVGVVREMRELHRTGETFTSLARQFNVSIETASKAVQGHGVYKEVK